MKQRRRISWLLIVSMFAMSLSLGVNEVHATDNAAENTEVVESGTGGNDNDIEDIEWIEQSVSNQSITAVDENGNVTEIEEENGMMGGVNSPLGRSSDGEIVNFNTKGNAVTSYTDAITGALGYTNGACGADAAYLGRQNGKIKFMLSGVIGLVDAAEVEVVNTRAVASISYYEVINGRLIHKISYNLNKDEYPSWVDNGPAPGYLEAGVQYYSYDGHYFYTRDRFSEMLADYGAGTRVNAVNSSSPYYNYYQFLPMRSRTSYTAAQLDAVINPTAASADSKMNNTGAAFETNQNTYGVNALLAMGIAASESAWGKSEIAQKKNNLFGLNAVDTSPGQSADTYDSPDACIKVFSKSYMSEQYLNPSDGKYSGGFLGNKGSGINVRYASDPYWGEKNASIAWMVDRKYGNADSNRYTLGVKDLIGTEHTELNVRTEASTSSNIIHTTKNFSNQTFIILGVSDTGFYKVQSDAALTSDRKRISSSGNYNYDTMYVYVSSDFVKKISDGSGGPVHPEDSNPGKVDEVAVPSELSAAIQYSAHVSELGWMDEVKNGQMMGTTGRNLPMEAMKISVSGIENLGVEYRAHVQDIGWMDRTTDGEVAGTVGKAKKIETVQLMLTGENAGNYDLYYRAHVSEFGWLDWAKNGELAGTQGYNYSLQAVQIALLPKGCAAPGKTLSTFKIKTVEIAYSTHVQDIGWEPDVENGSVAGTTGQNKKIEAMTIYVKSGIDLGIRYRSHVQDLGWQDYRRDGAVSGTVGENKRVEAIQIELTGTEKDNYDIYYRTHVQDLGWLGWAKNGEGSGTTGAGLKIEALQILIVPKGTPQIQNGDAAFIGESDDVGQNTNLQYSAHVQDIGWQNYVNSDEISGTTGLNKHMEAIKLKLSEQEVSGSIKYKGHVQDIGWMDAVSNDAIGGTVGQNKPMEAICIELTGELAKRYDIYYQVHCSEFGWLGWAKNGEKAGSEGYARHMEAIRIQLVKKGVTGPGDGTRAFYKK